MSKPRIAVLFSGQVRKNALNPDDSSDEIILNSQLINLFNDEFNECYDYDIFISTDKLNIQKAQELFDSHLKNIHFYETGYYLNEVHMETPPYEKVTKKPFNFEGKFVANGNLYQSFRLLDVHNLLIDYCNKTDTQYDLVVRARLDMEFKKSFVPHFREIIENSKIQAIAFQDQFIIGRPEIMKAYMRGLEAKYALYNLPIGNPGDWSMFIMSNEQYFKHFNDYYCKWAPEMQNTCVFLDYCYKKHINPGIALIGYNRDEYLAP